ncbi:putative fimbrial chaperone protein StfD [Salmonella enterica subsp. enterica serovar Heidelberg str. N4496]|nr:putative fimbrial chaperone protein StfD [Salmonella enterica subsp. enterica serovar Heidelberg str. N4496]
MMSLKRYNLAAVLLLLLGGYGSAQAAIAPDRTRLVFRGEDKSISVDLKNANSKLPYLAQSWVEDEKGVKITSPLIVVPPVQRIEPSAIGQVKIQGMPALASLPKDRETLFYYNVREIPPQSEQAQYAANRPANAHQSFLPPAGAIENRYAASLAIQDHPSASGQWLSGEQSDRLLRGVKQRQQPHGRHTSQRL